MGKFTYDINKYEPKQMVALPLALLILSVIFLAFNTISTGMPVEPGIDFAGGVSVTISTSDSVSEIESYFADYPLKESASDFSAGYLVFDYLDGDNFMDLTEHVTAKYPDATIYQMGETFGKTLQSQALWALLFAFVLMAIVVFVSFRIFIPSVAVVVSALSDIAITAAFMDVFGITLSLGTTAALLMLIGYSVDSDILLTTRLLKRQGKQDEKFSGAFRTGIIMTTTTLTAVLVMFIVFSLGQVFLIRDIAAVLLIGLIIDMMNTWMLNAGLLKWYLNRGGR